MVVVYKVQEDPGLDFGYIVVPFVFPEGKHINRP